MTTYTWKRLNHVLYTNYKNILLIPEKEFNKYFDILEMVVTKKRVVSEEYAKKQMEKSN